MTRTRIPRTFCGALLAAVLAVGSNEAQAQNVLPPPMTELNTADLVRGYTAVGRLELHGAGFCTGTLIDLDLVLTAAHCLFDKRTGQQVPVEGIRFLAGLRDGRYEAERPARRTMIHADYKYENEDLVARVSNDLALIELAQPIRNPSVLPFGVETVARHWGSVDLVSYARDREAAPSLQRDCRVLSQRQDMDVLSCEVDFGASGSPMFVTENGVSRVVGVVSAKAMLQGERVALAARVEGRLDALRLRMEQGDTLQKVILPQIGAPVGAVVGTALGASVRAGSSSARSGQGGAKFLRP